MTKKKVDAKKDKSKDVDLKVVVTPKDVVDPPVVDTEGEKAPKVTTEKAPKDKYIDEEITIEQPNGAKFKGLCIEKRNTNSGEQVCLKLNGCVSRYFNAKDIV